MTSEASSLELSRAGFVSRFMADLIDSATVIVGAAILVVAATTLRALLVGGVFQLPRFDRQAGVSGLSLLLFGYLTVFWTATGRTPGKQVAGLRVVTAHGHELGVVRAAARALLCLVFPVGLLYVLVSRRNRALHDILLGTAVVYDWHGRRPEARIRGPGRSERTAHSSS